MAGSASVASSTASLSSFSSLPSALLSQSMPVSAVVASVLPFAAAVLVPPVLAGAGRASSGSPAPPQPGS